MHDDKAMCGNVRPGLGPTTARTRARGVHVERVVHKDFHHAVRHRLGTLGLGGPVQQNICGGPTGQRVKAHFRVFPARICRVRAQAVATS